MRYVGVNKMSEMLDQYRIKQIKNYWGNVNQPTPIFSVSEIVQCILDLKKDMEEVKELLKEIKNGK